MHTYTHSLTHSCTHPLTHPPTHSLTDELEIVLAPDNSTATEGSTLIFVCVVYSLPLPSTITWTFNNSLITTSETNVSAVNIYQSQFEVSDAVFLRSMLEICGVTEAQAGYYACSAEGDAGSDSAMFTLSVQPQGMDKRLFNLPPQFSRLGIQGPASHVCLFVLSYVRYGFLWLVLLPFFLSFIYLS